MGDDETVFEALGVVDVPFGEAVGVFDFESSFVDLDGRSGGVAVGEGGGPGVGVAC